MDQVNPVVIVLMFVGRCLVPLLIMLGISYLLKRLGLIKEPPRGPNGNGFGNGANGKTENKQSEGEILHGKV